MANIWREPIFDRTNEDVTFALQQIAAWKKSHSHSSNLTIEDENLILSDNGITYVDGDSFVYTDGDSTAFVKNKVLVLEFGRVYDLKGCLNLSDITRIEDNISYIATNLAGYRYTVDVSTKEWVKDSLPTERDMKRIGNNIRSIFSTFGKPDEAATVPDLILSYEDINALEFNLYLLKKMLGAMVGSFIKSGTYKCGATNRLPIRR